LEFSVKKVDGFAVSETTNMRRMGHMTRMQWSVARDHRALTGENRKWLGCYADGPVAVRIRIVASPKMMNVFMM